MPLNIDLGAIADLIDDSLVWFQLWLLLLALALGLSVLAAAAERRRERNDPVGTLLRRRAH